jgi:hypothetical protein
MLQSLSIDRDYWNSGVLEIVPCPAHAEIGKYSVIVFVSKRAFYDAVIYGLISSVPSGISTGQLGRRYLNVAVARLG